MALEKIVIEGGARLIGEVPISGSKNAALPLFAASILCQDEMTFQNVPNLKDITTIQKVLRNLGVRITQRGDRCVQLDGSSLEGYEAPYDLVSTMRASVCVLGPLVAKKKVAEVSFPGGCIIGPRPIDLHLKGLETLGTKIHLESGYITAKASKLRGAKIYLGGHFGSSVLATANTMMAATLAYGTTIIENAACEPEIVDLARFLISRGADISAATPTGRTLLAYADSAEMARLLIDASARVDPNIL